MADGASDVAAPARRGSSRERSVAVAVVALGFGVAAGVPVGVQHIGLYLWNFAFLWGPQALVLGALLLLRARGAIVAGTALALALDLLAFRAWITGPNDAPGWLYYFLSVPGALVGAVAAALASRRAPRVWAVWAGVGAAAIVVAAVALNVWILRTRS